jgi:transposase
MRLHSSPHTFTCHKNTSKWVVERLFAWLQWSRILVKRYESHAENFLAMVHLGSMKFMFS